MTHSRTVATVLVAVGLLLLALVFYDVSLVASTLAMATWISEASVALLMLALVAICFISAGVVLRRNRIAPITA